MKAVVVLFVLLMVGAIIYVIWGKTRATASVMTSQDKNDLKDAITNFLTHRKYLSVSQSDSLMTFAMDKSASCIIAFLLLLIGFIPGILYLILGGSTKTLTVQFGTLQGQQGWNVRIQGQRSIVNRVKKVVGISQAALSPVPAQASYSPVVGAGNPQNVAVPQLNPVRVQEARVLTPPPAPQPQPVMPEASLASKVAPVADDNMSARSCPNCSSPVQPGLKFCQKCGTEMA
ncbi:MAG TPA: zinc ribbon domain-containing protein [Candidatus Anoxymicrobiaceae bacterium]